MAFNINSFLGEEIQQFIRENTDENPLFELSLEINRIINQNLDKFTKEDKTNKDLLVTALSIKALHTFNSVIILNKYGLEADSKALLRVLAENLFHVGAIISDEFYYEEYLKKADFQTLLILKNIINDKNKNYLTDNIIEEVSKVDFDTLEDIAKSMSKVYSSVYKTAEKAGMLGIYLYIYGDLSKYVHSNASIRDEYLAYEENLIVGFNHMPRIEGQQYVLVTANYLMIKLLELVSTLYKRELMELIDDLRNKNNQFYQRS